MPVIRRVSIHKPDLQAIREDKEEEEEIEDDDVFDSSLASSESETSTEEAENRKKQHNPSYNHKHLPPQVPDKNVDIDVHLDYVDNALSWLRKELRDLQKQDKELASAYINLIMTVNKLKKVKKTFTEQSDQIDRICEIRINPSHSMCDIPPKVNDVEQRYKRVGFQKRLYSFS